MQKKTKISSIAKSYADALYSLWQEDGVPYGYIYNEMQNIKELLDESQDLNAVLKSPVISLTQKFEIIDEVFKVIKDIRAVNFIKMLVENNRLDELDGIMAAFKDLTDKKNNFEHVTVTAAIELDDNQRVKVLDKLEKKLNKKLFIDWETNPDIIGGIIINIEENILDLSIKKKLDDITRVLIK